MVRLVRPWFANLGKRLIKAPKLYFCDVGLAAWLIGITDAAQLATHPLVVMEFVKHALNQGLPPTVHFYRDSTGLEVDLVVEYGVSPGQAGLVEIKAGRTFQGDWLRPMDRLAGLLGRQADRRMVVYGGAESYVREGVQVVGLGA